MDIRMILEVVEVLLSVGLFVVLLLKRKSDGEDRAATGKAYAELAVAAARVKGGTKADIRKSAVDGFKLIDATLDGKRDFTDAQAGVLVDAAMGES